MIKDIGKPCITALEHNHPEDYIRESIGLIIKCNYGRFPFERSVIIYEVEKMDYTRDHSDKALDAAINMVRTEMGEIEAIGIDDTLYESNTEFWRKKGFSKERYFMNGDFRHICIFDESDKKIFFCEYE